jgi:hypothetical protein
MTVELNNDNSTFEEWHKALCQVANVAGASAADADAWLSDYEAGKTPKQAWFDEWGSP